MVPSRSQISTMSPVRSARSRRLLLASRHIRTATPFSLTSIRIRTPTTSTAAPPAMTSASPDAGALASPFTMTTNVAMTTATAAMMVAAPALVTGDRRTPEQAAAGPPSAVRSVPRWLRHGSRSKPRGDGLHPGRQAEQARGHDHGELLKDPLMPAGDPRAHPERVRARQHQQRDVRHQHPAPGGGQHRQQRAEDRQVGERVQQVDQERRRPLDRSGGTPRRRRAPSR